MVKMHQSSSVLSLVYTIVNTEETSLKFFPNKKTSIQFDDFCELYKSSVKSLEADDDIISSIFEMFDPDRYSSNK